MAPPPATMESFWGWVKYSQSICWQCAQIVRQIKKVLDIIHVVKTSQLIWFIIKKVDKDIRYTALVTENYRSKPDCVSTSQILNKMILNYITFLIIHFYVQPSLKSRIEQNAEVSANNVNDDEL